MCPKSLKFGEALCCEYDALEEIQIVSYLSCRGSAIRKLSIGLSRLADVLLVRAGLTVHDEQ